MANPLLLYHLKGTRMTFLKGEVEEGRRRKAVEV